MFDKYNNNATIKLNCCSNQAGYTPLLGMRGGVCCFAGRMVDTAIFFLFRELKTGPGGEMVDTLVSGASAAMHAGSSPVLGT